MPSLDEFVSLVEVYSFSSIHGISVARRHAKMVGRVSKVESTIEPSKLGRMVCVS